MPEPTPLSPTDLMVDRSDSAVAVITINRPKRRNAMSLAMWKEVGRLFDGLNAEPAVRAIILTGAGGAFSGGADISEFGAVRVTPEDGRAYDDVANGSFMSIATSMKPTIAAISGPCYGGAVGLALSCDFRVADASAHMAVPAARLSNVYGIVETRAVFDAVGLAAAKEVLFTGRRYDVEEAHRIGLVTHLAEAGTDALEGARKLAQSMANCAPLTIKGSKIILDAIARGQTDSRREAIDSVMDEAMASDDYKEGVKAFAEKRDPVFRGK